MARKPGAKKEDLSDESTAKLLKVAKQLVRKDFGGKNPLQSIEGKMAAKGVECGPVSCQAILDIIEEQINGIKKRQFDRLDEAIKRVSTPVQKPSTPVQEKLP